MLLLLFSFLLYLLKCFYTHTLIPERFSSAESGPWAIDGVQRTTTVDQTAEPSSLTPSVATATGLVYDERMMEHLNLWDR